MAVAKDIKFALLNTVFPAVIYALLHLYARTLHVRFEGMEELGKHLESGGRVIVASWHQRFFGGFFLPRLFRWSPVIMISKSRDGDFISQIVQRIGWIPVRGSSSRGGKEALKRMVQGVTDHRVGGHIVDGPTGPPRVVKPGLVSLARNASATVCPGIVSYEKAWVMNSWDRFMVPKPFSRILFRFGPLSVVPAVMTEREFEDVRKALEDELVRLYDAADAHWKNETPPRGCG